MSGTSVETIEIAARDGLRLAATIFEPAGTARSTVILQAATAVPRGFYAAFADHLAGLGRRVVTFDYRGIGGSRPASLRGFPATMLDWADQDARAVADHAAAAWPNQPLGIVGHSFGGQAFGLAPHPRVTHVVGIAAQIGDMRLFDSRVAGRIRFLSRYLAPVLIPFAGYFPAGWFGMGENMPGGVFRQWTRWCLTPDYFFGDPQVGAAERFAAVTARVHLIGFDDDPFGPAAAIEGLAKGFPAGLATTEFIAAKTAPGGKIGHFGFFRTSTGRPFWDQVDARLG
ncbi:alpha/beta hydrolase family protein [Phreatobacter stygius]|uniref:Alpha/beta fold hydrolase n=1 Tax=Phreatobacter stygius TaxID=1940610 RepID=A0A4D7BM12_9HYPH|nr:alpha/beta fold hydrolase [Phreatobacter stygius]QCI68767.1 alpha/beta fold hydrolase [Phreatobacter stygius]